MASANGTKPGGVAYRKFSHKSLELRLPARAECVPALRALVRSWLEEVRASKRAALEMLLATNEAFTNAIEHPHEPTSHFIDVEGSLIEGCVTISIHDHGTSQKERARKEHGGFGLVLIDALMDTVQVSRDVHGTTVTMQRRLANH